MWRRMNSVNKCVRCCEGVHHTEVWAVSCLRLRLVQFDIPQAEPITFPDKKWIRLAK